MAPNPLADIFPELTETVDPHRPNILRAMYDQILATSSQPDFVRAVFRELVQTRQTLHVYVDKCAAIEEAKTNVKNELYEERNKISELEQHIDKKTEDVLSATTSLAVEKDRVKEEQEKTAKVTREKSVVEEAYKKQARTIQEMKKKRKAPADEETGDDRHLTKKPKPSHPDHAIVACNQCYSKDWPCDGTQHCSSCIKHGLSKQECKRVKCQSFDGECKKQACGLAHRVDGYAVVLAFRKVSRKRYGSPPA